MTLSALGIFSAAGAGGGVSLSDYELITTATISGSSSEIVLSSLDTYSSTYKHLQVRFTLRSSRSATDDAAVVRFTGGGGSHVSHRLVGNGSTVTSAADTSGTHMYIGQIPAANFTASAFHGGVIDILDAYSTTKNKTIRVLAGRPGTNNEIALHSGFYFGSTAAVSAIYIGNANGGNFTSTSRISIYGTKG